MGLAVARVSLAGTLREAVCHENEFMRNHALCSLIADDDYRDSDDDLMTLWDYLDTPSWSIKPESNLEGLENLLEVEVVGIRDVQLLFLGNVLHFHILLGLSVPWIWPSFEA